MSVYPVFLVKNFFYLIDKVFLFYRVLSNEKKKKKKKEKKESASDKRLPIAKIR